MADISFVGVSDVDKVLLTYLEPEEVIGLCRANRYFRRLCRDDDVWHYFIRRDYGENMVRYAGDENFIDFYWTLRKEFKNNVGETLFKGKNRIYSTAIASAIHGYLPIFIEATRRYKFDSSQIEYLLSEAVENCQINVFKYVLKVGIVTVEDLNDQSILMHRVCYELAKYFLEIGVDVNMSDGMALQNAAYQKNRAVAELYLEYGADPTRIEKKAKRWLKDQKLIK